MFKQAMGKMLGIKALETPDFKGSVELSEDEQKQVFATTQHLTEENAKLTEQLKAANDKNKDLQTKMDDFEKRFAALEAGTKKAEVTTPVQEKTPATSPVATPPAATTETKANEDKTAALIAANAHVLTPQVTTPSGSENPEIVALKEQLAKAEEDKKKAIASYNKLAEESGATLTVEAGEGENKGEGEKHQNRKEGNDY